MELFLENFLEYAVRPGTHNSDIGEVEPEYPHFTGFVFKVRICPREYFSIYNLLRLAGIKLCTRKKWNDD